MKDVAWMTNEEVIAEARRREDRRRSGQPLAETPAEAAERIAEDDARLEKEIQREVVNTYTALGCKVYNLSQARATKQTPGLPDLWVVCLRSGWSRQGKVAWWHETKTPTGKQSEDQREFQRECKACHVVYVLGGILAAEEQLITFGIAERINGTLEPVRRK
jgi:hypothetical protein